MAPLILIQRRGMRKAYLCGYINANDCSVNLSDLSKMLVKKQMQYFDVPLDHAWKVPILQELLNTRTNNIYAEGCDDYVINEMINILCNE